MVYTCPRKEFYVAAPFIVSKRPPRGKNPKKSHSFFFVWYRDPVSGARLPRYRFSIDVLNQRLSGVFSGHVSSKAEAYRIAQDALDKGLIFSTPEETTVLLVPFIESFWEHDYRKAKEREFSSITEMQCHKLLATFRKHCKPILSPSLELAAFKVYMMDAIKQAMFDKGLSGSAINQAIESIRTPLNYAYRHEIIPEDIGGKLKNVVRNKRQRASFPRQRV